ncbi:pyridoxal-phosphate dependent enzyme [Chloroflexota bacterium]
MSESQTTLFCPACNQTADPLDWRCPTCAGPLELTDLPPFDAAAIRDHEWSMWRYAAMLPTLRRFSLGEGMTPLVPTAVGDHQFLAKLDYLLPTSSYKDRGVALTLNYLLDQGVAEIVEDSSGNAGASTAAYAGGIGLKARIFVPATAPANKKQQISHFGAELVEVEGSRADVTTACENAARTATYASHAWNPYFVAGQMTCAWEIWEQMGRRAPEAIAVPCGQGGLLLGLYEGFKKLLEAELIKQLPRLYAVQSDAYDGIVRAWEAGADEPESARNGDTIADGIRITKPVRGRAILTAIRESDGAALRVKDHSIRAAQAALARHGLFVEPTSATPAAALEAVQTHLGKKAEIVVPLTGSGLKATT